MPRNVFVLDTFRSWMQTVSVMYSRLAELRETILNVPEPNFPDAQESFIDDIGMSDLRVRFESRDQRSQNIPPQKNIWVPINVNKLDEISISFFLFNIFIAITARVWEVNE